MHRATARNVVTSMFAILIIIITLNIKTVSAYGSTTNNTLFLYPMVNNNVKTPNVNVISKYIKSVNAKARNVTITPSFSPITMKILILIIFDTAPTNDNNIHTGQQVSMTIRYCSALTMSTTDDV